MLDDLAREVHDPDFRDARPRAERQLHPAVVGEGGVGDLDQQQNVSGTGERAPVIAGAEHREVGLRLGALVEPHRVLDADDGLVAHALHQQPGQRVDAREVPGAYGGHLDDLALYELDPVVLVEYPGLAHAVVLVDGKTPPCNLLRLRIHESPPVVRSSQREVYPSETALPRILSDLSTYSFSSSSR